MNIGKKINPSILKNISFSLILFFILTPFVWLSLFAVPSADDYDSAGKAVHMGYLSFQLYLYTHWNGRYIATALQSSPFLMHFWVYRLIPMLLFVFFVHSFYKLFSEVSPFNYYSKIKRMYLALAVLALYLAQIVITSNFYWLSGSVTYVLPIILLNYFLTYLYRIIIKKDIRKINFTLASLFIFLIIGTDEVIMFFLDFIILIAFLFSFFRDRKFKINWNLLFLGLVALASSVLETLAPGNRVRIHADRDIMLSVVGALYSFFKNEYTWIFGGSMVWIVAFPIFFLVIYAFYKQKKSMLEKTAGYLVNPLFAIGLWFVSNVFCFFIHYWALGGDEGPDRTVALIQFLFFLSLFYVLCTSAFWFWRRYSKRLGKSFFQKGARISYTLVGLAVAVLFFSSQNVHRAYSDMTKGESVNFYYANRQAQKLMLASGSGKIYIPRKIDVPKITSYRGKENFEFMARYFGKDVSVVKDLSFDDFYVAEKYFDAPVDAQGKGVYFDADSRSIVFKFKISDDLKDMKVFVETFSSQESEKIQRIKMDWNFKKSKINGFAYHVFRLSDRNIKKIDTYQINEAGEEIWKSMVK